MIGSTVAGYLLEWLSDTELDSITGEVGDVGLDTPFDVDLPTEKGLF